MLLPGLEITPTDYATKSPNDLDMANPGISCFFNQTLYGPTDYPDGVLSFLILPPAFEILAFSSFSSGLWSVLKDLYLYLSPIYFTIITRESPAFAVKYFFP